MCITVPAETVTIKLICDYEKTVYTVARITLTIYNPIKCTYTKLVDNLSTILTSIMLSLTSIRYTNWTNCLDTYYFVLFN